MRRLGAPAERDHPISPLGALQEGRGARTLVHSKRDGKGTRESHLPSLESHGGSCPQPPHAAAGASCAA